MFVLPGLAKTFGFRRISGGYARFFLDPKLCIAVINLAANLSFCHQFHRLFTVPRTSKL